VKKLFLVLNLAMLWPPAASRAQVYAPNEAGVAMGHWHTIVRDVEATKKFWILLGGTPIQVDGTEVIKFPGILVFLTPGSPSGGTIGTTVDHVGLRVPNGQELMAKLKSGGVKLDANHAGTRLPGATGWGYIYSPDDLRVEILDNVEALKKNDLTAPNAADHTHFLVPESSTAEAQAWYVKLSGATPLQENTVQKTLGGDLPGGIRLRFGKAPHALLPVKGRALDQIGFEVKKLEAFCKKLEAGGVKLDQPYSKSRHKSFASAELTDPWGTSIELTEGLNRF
jgi:glyoxalase/bleomycin resistance protein/dioxygenase superfamily protein